LFLLDEYTTSLFFFYQLYGFGDIASNGKASCSCARGL